jgi:hypothetical protein
MFSGDAVASNNRLKVGNALQSLRHASLHDASHGPGTRSARQLPGQADSAVKRIFKERRIMRTVSKLMLAGAVASMFVTAGAYAEGSKIVTRSPEAAQADLVRDWNFTGAGVSIPVRERTKSEMQADLVRDWNGPSKATIASEEKSIPQSRTTQQAHDDLVRNWRG